METPPHLRQDSDIYSTPAEFEVWNRRRNAGRARKIVLWGSGGFAAFIVIIVAIAVLDGAFTDHNAGDPKKEHINSLVVDGQAAIFGWFQENLRDPSSLDVISIRPVGGDESANQVVFAVKYRANNGFGGKNVSSELFLTHGNQVVSVTNMSGP